MPLHPDDLENMSDSVEIIDLPLEDEEVVVYDELPSKETVLEVHDQLADEEAKEAKEDSEKESEEDFDVDMGLDHMFLEHKDRGQDIEVSFDLPNVPGAPADAQGDIVVEEEPSSDENNLLEVVEQVEVEKPKSVWDWEAYGLNNFVHWVKERLQAVPKHSGYDTAGIERAISYLQKIDTEISKAMRSDLHEEISANDIETARKEIDDGIHRLQERLEKVESTYKAKSKRKKKTGTESHSLTKEAQKITGVQGVVITVPLFISRLGRICINSTISAGHDMEDTFDRLSKKYALNQREEAELMQFIEDMGYPLHRDRGFDRDEDIDPAASNNYDWSSQYTG